MHQTDRLDTPYHMSYCEPTYHTYHLRYSPKRRKMALFQLCAKMARYFQLFLEQQYHHSMRLDEFLRFIWVCWGGTASVKKVICKKPRIRGSRNFWHILAQRRGDNPIPTRGPYCQVDEKFSGTFGFS